MLKTKLITLAAFVAFIAAPTLVSAEDGTPKVSYSAKKQGRVAFQNKTQDETAAAQDVGTFNPADIEPAAGSFEPQNNTQENSLADSLRLPRKN